MKKKNLKKQLREAWKAFEEVRDMFRYYDIQVDKPVILPCHPHPKAPHGFNRNGSHNENRYVCDCEDWSFEDE